MTRAPCARRLALCLMTVLALSACTALEAPQPCYRDAQCPPQMACVEAECTLKTVALNHEFEPLPLDQDLKDLGPKDDMGVDMGDDMMVSPFPASQSICAVDIGELLPLEVDTDELGNPARIVNQHKFFCYGGIFGVLGYDLSEQEPSGADPNALTLNVLGEDGAWAPHSCNGVPFPKVDGRGLHSVRLVNSNAATSEFGEDLTLELTYKQEGRPAFKQAFQWSSCVDYPLPPDRRELRSGGELSSYETGEGLSLGTWLLQSGQGEVAFHDVDGGGELQRCQPSLDTLGVSGLIDIWGGALGGQWFSWFMMIERGGDNEAGELILSIQDQALNAGDQPCSATSFRVGYWPLDKRAQRDWRSWIEPHSDPLSGELWYCNSFGSRLCRLNRWRQETGLQWLTDPQGENINLTQAMSFEARAGALVVRERRDSFPFYQLHMYTPCDERTVRSEEATLSTCLEHISTIDVYSQLPDYQVLYGQEPGMDSAKPYLFWIERQQVNQLGVPGRSRWVVRRQKF